MSDQLDLKLERIDPTTIVWHPKPDISTFELTQALDVLLALYRPDLWAYAAAKLAMLPKDVKRHFHYQEVS